MVRAGDVGLEQKWIYGLSITEALYSQFTLNGIAKLIGRWLHN